MDKSKFSKKELLGFGNPESSTGLCTLWTPKEKILRELSSENYHIAGQCYSNQEGVNLIIRNCLANKKIHRIVLCGVDIGNVGDILIALKRKGVDENGKIIGFETEIESEIPLEAIERFRENVEIIDKREIRDYKLLDGFLRELENKKPWGEPEIYKKSFAKPPEVYSSEKTGFVIRGGKVGDVWLEILQTIMKFGYVKKTQYADNQKEVTCLVSVISDENPYNIKWEDYFQFNEEHLRKYLPQLLDTQGVGDVSYTYGSKLRDFKGVNQIDSIVKELKKAIYSRRAVAVIWDVEKDHDNPNSPCLDLIQALVQDKLNLTAYFRSNDMFGAWPENALALRAVQYEIANRLGVEVGDLVIVSNSAHIYEQDWEKALEILKENSVSLKKCPDPRGNVLIEIEEGKVKITHLDVKGKKLEEFFVSSAVEGYKKISEKKIISEMSHALDIGGELAKAEIALKKGLGYVQDGELSV